MSPFKHNLFLNWICTGLFVLLTALTSAHTLSPNEYLIWGISSDALEIPEGFVITEAVLTIHDLVPAKTRLYVHLLDNPNEGVQRGSSEESGDIFSGYGVPLSGKAGKGKWACRFSRVNDKKSLMWSRYPYPYTLILADGSKVSLSSSLLELMDYAGNGGGFGFGFNFKDISTFTQITLDVTIESFQGDYQKQTFSYPISNLYSYNETTGRWDYAEDAEPAEWELAAEASLPVFFKSIQVSAGRIQGQDTLKVSGSFTKAPELLLTDSIGVSVLSLSDGAEIFTEACGYTWNRTKNRFVWTRRKPGGVTSLTFDFAKRSFAMTLSKADLTGLSCPIGFAWTFGDYRYYGEADESIVNGKQRIPIRLMRNYRDEIRISKAVSKRGKAPSTDQLSITGEIAAADVAGTNVSALPVIIMWGEQSFTLPAGSFQKGKGNVYTCRNAASSEGGLFSCKIDLDKCIFSILAKNLTIDLVPGSPDQANLQIGMPEL
jgi:hypothetical protein